MEGKMNFGPEKGTRRNVLDVRTVSPETVRDTVNRLKETIRDPSNFLDKGGAAKVYRLPDGICMKVMEPRHDSPIAHQMDLGNTVEAEARFLKDLSSFSVKGARSPRYVGYMRNGSTDNMSVILMEELRAVNLQHIMNRTQEMPKSFDADVFMTSLEEYVHALNEKKHVIHGDLEPRNIMVDIASGLPRIIDFGRSISTRGMPEHKKTTLINKEAEQLDVIGEKIDAFVSDLTNGEQRVKV